VQAGHEPQSYFLCFWSSCNYRYKPPHLPLNFQYKLHKEKNTYLKKAYWQDFKLKSCSTLREMVFVSE
jgi:hypothetical protein